MTFSSPVWRSATAWFGLPVRLRREPRAFGEIAVTPAKPAGRIESIEALRGIAALLVVFYHLQYIFGTRLGVVPFGGLFGAGDHGVDLFFVLSGFIIMSAHKADIGRPERAGPYLFKRACRVFPSVWIVTAAALALYALRFGGAEKAAKLDPWSIAASVLLLPQDGPALVNVTWTLKYELFFYALFALLIARRRLGVASLLGWQGGVLLAGFVALPWLGLAVEYYLRPICLEFGIGMICAVLVARCGQGSARRAYLLWCVLLALGAGTFFGSMVCAALWNPHGLEAVRVPVFGLGSGAMIAALALLERDGRVRAPSPLVRLGAASYAIYLVHYSVLTLVAVALLRLGWTRPDGAALLGCAALGIGAGIAFHLVVDAPIQGRLRRLGRHLFGDSATARAATARTSLGARGLNEQVR